MLDELAPARWAVQDRACLRSKRSQQNGATWAIRVTRALHRLETELRSAARTMTRLERVHVEAARAARRGDRRPAVVAMSTVLLGGRTTRRTTIHASFHDETRSILHGSDWGVQIAPIPLEFQARLIDAQPPSGAYRQPELVHACCKGAAHSHSRSHFPFYATSSPALAKSCAASLLFRGR